MPTRNKAPKPSCRRQGSRKTLVESVLLLLGVFAAVTAKADRVIEDTDDAQREEGRAYIVVPYVFSTEALETGVGAVYFRHGVFQPQDGLFVTGFGTTNSSYALFGGMTNVQLADRLFFNPMIGAMSNDQQRFYGDYGYDVGTVRSGTNDSSEDDFVFGSGIDAYVHLTFRYVFPIGAGEEPQPHRYTTSSGLLADGSTYRDTWNPFESGRTVLHVRPFYQRRTLEVGPDNVDLIHDYLDFQEGDEPDISTNGLEVALEYDNRDFAPNPSRGSLTRLKVTRDFGAFDSFDSWTNVDFSFAKYWDLGDSDRFAHRVFAANVWSSYTPTWETEAVTPDFVAVRHRPPSNRGATLGGVERLRGFPRGRFNDKAAIYYAAELRLIPKWDPFRNWPIIRSWPWRWWQAVVFAEAGRVAPDWDLGDLHEDLKWTAGAGVRVMIGGGIIRLDMAASEENTQWWVMAKQAF